MKSLQTSSWSVDVTRSSATVLSLGHGDSVSLSMNATSLVSYMGTLYSTNSSSIFPIPIYILLMFELPSVHYRGDNLTALEDTSISFFDFFIIDSSADGGYVYNTTTIADFGILRSVLTSAFPAFTTMEVRELETSTKILCSETTKQSMSVVQTNGTVVGMNQLVQFLVLTPRSNYNGNVTAIDFTISLNPETLSNDTYSSSFALYVRPVDEDPRLIVSPTAATASIGYSLPSISVFDPDFLSACRSEFGGDAADKMSITISLTVDRGYLLVPALHDLYDGFYVPVSWQLKQTTAL
jgi:hypothetical protein